MKRNFIFSCILLFTTGILIIVPTGYAKQLGHVHFPISCKASAQKTFNDALALTHHMMYIQAEKKFRDIIENNPKCAMAYWGIALTQTHPLWGAKPSHIALNKGAIALQKAKRLHPPTKRERAYINALTPLYRHWKKVPYKRRLAAWEKAQNALYKQFPNDPDAIALYALAHLAIAPKSDRTFKNQKTAGNILENMHQKYPTHPAGFHYTIHAYDNPKLAKKAEKIAQDYDKIAPDVPHALHMPSHIFVRLGRWPETIRWNIRSAAAAKRQALKGGIMPMHYAHAMDYLMYAYLQQGQIKKATEVLAETNAVNKYQDSFATAYGIAATRARFYLEQHRWASAAKISLNKPKSFPWAKYPAAESILLFAQGLGAINIGDTNTAKLIIKKLNAIDNLLRQKNENYWATLVRSKQKSLSAWLALANGDNTNALRLMKSAANLEDSVDKHPVTPGEVLPARELLGNMLLKLNKPKPALAAYQASLKISPNRLNSIYGAGLAAEKMGNTNLAKQYYEKLIKITKHADTPLPEVIQAKQFTTSTQ